MDCIVHGVPKSWMWLSDFHFLLYWNTEQGNKDNISREGLCPASCPRPIHAVSFYCSIGGHPSRAALA